MRPPAARAPGADRLAARARRVATRIDPEDPLSALEVRDVPEPDPPEGWEVVEVRAAALNHHDLWTLRGVGVDPEGLPQVLGTDVAGVTAARPRGGRARRAQHGPARARTRPSPPTSTCSRSAASRARSPSAWPCPAATW